MIVGKLVTVVGTLVASADAAGLRNALRNRALESTTATASASLYGTSSSAYFGDAVDVSGDLVIVGARRTNSGVGAAYVVSTDDTGTMHELENPLTSDWSYFGEEVAIDGSTAVVGAFFGDHEDYNDCGEAFVYTQQIDGSWKLLQTLERTREAQAYFGDAVDISGDWILVGASAGKSAYFYKVNSDGTFELQQTVSKSASEFGNAVSIDGDYAAVGSWAGDSGKIFVYEKDADDSWSLVSTLTCDACESGYDLIGKSVSLSGDRLVVGTHSTSVWSDDSYPGFALVFRRGSDGKWTLEATLAASDGVSNDYFGYDVALYGSRIVVGAYGADDAGSSAGKAYVFELDSSSGTWTETHKMLGAVANDRFGQAVATGSGMVAVGAYAEDTGASSAGAVYLYTDL